MGLLKDVLKDIKPIEKDNDIALFLKKLSNLVEKNNIKAEVFAGGSIAKGTFLKNDYDVDVKNHLVRQVMKNELKMRYRKVKSLTIGTNSDQNFILR